jgi:hypothetical protein
MLAGMREESACKSLAVYQGGKQERFSKPPPSATRPSLLDNLRTGYCAIVFVFIAYDRKVQNT